MKRNRARVTAEAFADIEAVRRYTRRNYGVEKEREYIGNIWQKAHELAEKPNPRGRHPVAPGVYQERCGSHYPIYSRTAEVIEIGRVLHGEMDLDKLSERDARQLRSELLKAHGPAAGKKPETPARGRDREPDR